MVRRAWGRHAPARAAALAAALAAGEAAAGAWTQPPGAGFLSVGANYYATDPGTYEEVASALYVEYGAFEAVTLGGALETSAPVGVSSGQEGDLTITGFARFRLYQGPQGDPFSAQAGVTLPLGDVVDTGQAQLDRERDIDLRLLYGRGFGTDWGDAFIDAQAGLRLRLEDSADEIRLDLTAGLRPAGDWLLLAQAFGTLGLRNADPFGDDFDVLKLAPSVGYRITDGAMVVLGVEREVAGRNIDLGTRFKLAVWTTF